MPEFCRAYLDDIVIFSDTWEEHLQHFLQVITRLKHYGLTLKGNKCQIGMAACSYLGNTVGKGQIALQMAKVEGSMNLSTTSHQKHVRAFLALADY